MFEPLIKKDWENWWMEPLCVDFRNLNRNLDKENYHMPSMEQILQIVSGSKMLSLLDRYFGYNQVLVAEFDRLKTTFRMKWGTFAFRWMSFRLINIGATFQYVMDITFHGLIGHSIVVCLDNVIVFSKHMSDHIHHLKKIFYWCHKYKISFNPKRSIFAVSKGNLLGHIIAKSWIKLDPDTVRTIM